MKILNTIGKKYTEKAKGILEKFGSVDCLDPSQEKLAEIIADYDILVVGLGLNINKEVIDNGKNLKIIATATTGLDHIDVKAAEERNIKILSLRGETDFLDTITGTAELAFALMLDLLRLTHPAFASVKNYKWERENFRGHNLYGLTLGVVGLGRLGKWMARYGNAFGMKVLASDPHVDKDLFEKLNCENVSFKDLAKRSDVISVHVHLGQETENMFDADIFSQMKNTAYLINTSRGKIVNEEDVLKALEEKKIAGYGTDVLADELNFNQGFSKHALVEYAKTHDNCIIVPHIGGMTYESREATDIFIAEKILSFVKK